MGLLALPPPTVGLGTGIPNQASISAQNLAVPTGVESIYRYNGLLLNDKSTVDKYRILRIEGLSDADVRDQREVNPSRHGETALTSLYGGRTIAMMGRIEAWTLAKLRDMVMALKIACAPLVESPLLVLTAQGFARDHQINCRKVQPLQITEEQVNQWFYRDFLLTLRASSSRIVSRQLFTTSTTFTGSSAPGETVMSVGNGGTFPAQPMIVLRGPMVNPSVGVLTWDSGTPLSLTSSLAAGQERWIDIGNRTITDEFGVQRFSEFLLGSSWPELLSGDNGVTFAASGLSAQSSLTFYHRWAWL